MSAVYNRRHKVKFHDRALYDIGGQVHPGAPVLSVSLGCIQVGAVSRSPDLKAKAASAGGIVNILPPYIPAGIAKEEILLDVMALYPVRFIVHGIGRLKALRVAMHPVVLKLCGPDVNSPHVLVERGLGRPGSLVDLNAAPVAVYQLRCNLFGMAVACLILRLVQRHHGKLSKLVHVRIQVSRQILHDIACQYLIGIAVAIRHNQLRRPGIGANLIKADRLISRPGSRVDIHFQFGIVAKHHRRLCGMHKFRHAADQAMLSLIHRL